MLVCFSHLRWNFVRQRPQHLLTRAAKWFDVLFIEEPVFEAGGTARLKREGVGPSLEVLVPIVDPADTQSLAQVLHGLVARELDGSRHRTRVFWYYTPAALAFTQTLHRDLTIYDNMDELSAFRGASDALVSQERTLLATADLVFTGGYSLYAAKRDAHPDIHCFPSSVETAHFARARHGTTPDPADQAALARPRLGFFGVVDERFDADFLAQFADLRPEWQFVILGPVVKIDPAELPKRPNIHWLGPKLYDDLPDYLAHWDLGLMSFAVNAATRFISPTKTPEFLAAGLPVISTPIVDVVRGYGEAGLVEIADTPGTAALAAEALMARARAPWLARVDARLAGDSWDRTWADMEARMMAVLGEPMSDSPRPVMRETV
ncbi:glycosyl transferase [Methylobacterium sp. Leaf112]|nr:glycosyl transferase [Methylobacterium sp. Leaf112]